MSAQRLLTVCTILAIPALLSGCGLTPLAAPERPDPAAVVQRTVDAYLEALAAAGDPFAAASDVGAYASTERAAMDFSSLILPGFTAGGPPRTSSVTVIDPPRDDHDTFAARMCLTFDDGARTDPAQPYLVTVRPDAESPTGLRIVALEFRRGATWCEA